MAALMYLLNIPANCLLKTMDVKLLHMNIPDTEGVSTVKAAFECCPGKSVSIKVIVTFLALSTANITYK